MKIIKNTVTINKNYAPFLANLKRGYSIRKALALCLEKIGWYYLPDELDIKEFKTCYHLKPAIE